MRKLFPIFLLVLLICTETFAQRQYHCAGKVQYRVCGDDRAIPALATQQMQYFTPPIEDDAPRARMKMRAISPSVVATQYSFHKEKDVGVWTGFVHGEGPVALELLLNKVGSPPELRYMGKAILRGKASPFEFRSSPPRSSRWSWQILAKNVATDGSF